MASQSRVPPAHLRRPLSGPSTLHADPYGPPIRPSHGGFPPFDMMPPPEVLEQKLSLQHVEIEKLAKENQRLAATHGSLRQDLATAKHDLQLVHDHIVGMKSEKEQQTRGLTDKISSMETELKASEPIKMELQQARAKAQGLVAERQDLISKVQQLTRNLQMAHSEAQQIPVLMSELENLRREYQHHRATYEYEKKLYKDHLESLQVMEKDYMAMSREVDKLRAQLTNSTQFDPRTEPNAHAGGLYGGANAYNQSVPSGNMATGQMVYGNGYGVIQAHQGQSPLVGGSGGGGAATVGSSTGTTGITSVNRAPGAGGTGTTLGASPHGVAHSADAGSGPADASKGPGYDAKRGPTGPGYDGQKGPTGPGYDGQKGPTGPGYDAQRGSAGAGYDMQRGSNAPGYDAQRASGGPGYNAHRASGGPGYDKQRVPGSMQAYEVQSGPGYDTPRPLGYDTRVVPGYEANKTHAYQEQRAAFYDTQRGSGNDAQRGANYDASKAAGYASSSRGSVANQGQVPMSNTYASTGQTARSGGGYEAPPQGGNSIRR